MNSFGYLHQGSFLLNRFNFNSSISKASNHMPGKMWDEITFPFPNVSDCIVEVWEWINNLGLDNIAIRLIDLSNLKVHMWWTDLVIYTRVHFY